MNDGDNQVWCDSTSDYKPRKKFNPDQIHVWMTQLYEPKMQYLKTKILLSSLKEIIDVERVLHPDTASKIKKVVLFGDLNDYLELPLASDTPYKSKMGTILGIDKKLATKNISLTTSEKLNLTNIVKQHIYKKIKSIMEVFELIKSDTPPSEVKEKMAELPTHLKVLTDTKNSAEVAVNTHIQFQNYFKKCNKELRNMYDLLERLVQVRINVLSPNCADVLDESGLCDRTVYFGSRIFNLTLQNDVYSPEVVKALKIINDKQKEEIENKKSEVLALKQEIAEYEGLEKFDVVLTEYINVERKLLEQKRTFKEMLNRSFVFQ